MIKAFDEKYEKHNEKLSLVMEEYHARHAILIEKKERLIKLKNYEANVKEVKKLYDEKMHKVNRYVKDVESSEVQVQKCEELLRRLQQEHNEILQQRKQKEKEDKAEIQKMRKVVESLKQKKETLDMQLETVRLYFLELM